MPEGTWPLLLLAALALVAGWLESRTARADGVLLRAHPYRRLLWVVTPSRNAAAVTFDTRVDATALVAYLERADAAFGAHLTHAVVAAVLAGLAEVPRMNRFVVGQRLYQRRGEWVTFSMKRSRLDPKAKLAMVKLRGVPGESFRELVGRIDAEIGVQRSDAVTHEDREYGWFDRFPRVVLQVAVRLLRWLDARSLLPAGFVEGDGLFTSVVVANLGSLGMGPAYHHLYEWGNCPLFLTVGAIEPQPVVVDGRLEIRPVLPLRWTYDERIDDGLNARFGIDAVVAVLEHPDERLGCLASDGADRVPIDRGRVAPG